jgi:uncharacterized protein YbjQ (UPF0145 family)
LQARRRLAELAGRRAFTSDLTVNEFDTVRAVGFEPVGQVLGTSVYQLGFAGWGTCGIPLGGSAMIMGPGAWGAGSGFAPLVRALQDVRHRAMERARAETAALGGDGVVAVRLSMRPFPGAPQTLEFEAIGTAVRSIGRHRPPRPFLSDLSGQDFAKVIEAGWVPVDLIFGVAVEVRHDDYRTRMARSVWNQSNTEIPGYTELVTHTRARCRDALVAELSRVGGEVATVADMTLRIGEQECRAYGGGTDHVAETTILGTALVEYGAGRRPRGARRLAVLPLTDRPRRPAARTR